MSTEIKATAQDQEGVLILNFGHRLEAPALQEVVETHRLLTDHLDALRDAQGDVMKGRDRVRLCGILEEVAEETRRQDEKWPWPRDAGHLGALGAGWKENGTSFSEEALMGLEELGRDDLESEPYTWGAIIAEELGEAWRAATMTEARAELVQSVAVIVSIIQHIDEAQAK